MVTDPWGLAKGAKLWKISYQRKIFEIFGVQLREMLRPDPLRASRNEVLESLLTRHGSLF